jgi:hypothetical protein
MLNFTIMPPHFRSASGLLRRLALNGASGFLDGALDLVADGGLALVMGAGGCGLGAARLAYARALDSGLLGRLLLGGSGGGLNDRELARTRAASRVTCNGHCSVNGLV